MGRDITAFKNAKAKYPFDDYFCENRHEDCYSFRAGSFHAHRVWCNWLSETILNCTANFVRDNYTYKNKPFYQLINFTDAEGFIETTNAKKLAQDFADHQHIIDKLSCDQWLKDLYANWHKAFEYAADNGFVDFH